MPRAAEAATPQAGLEKPLEAAALEAQFEREEEEVRAASFRIAGGLVILFMLLGCLLDMAVQPDLLSPFLAIRITCALMLLTVLLGLRRIREGRALIFLGHLIAFLPMGAILLMIEKTGGGDSPYYAGLCLVLAGSAMLLRWRTWDSVVSALVCLVSFAIEAWHNHLNWRRVDNNGYYLGVTALFTCAGTYFYNRLRFNEFRLRHEVEASRRTAEESHQRLQALDQAKTRFFSNVSHELRTPLTLILGPLEQLKRAPGLAADRKNMELMTMLEENGLRLLRLINELLDLVKLDTAEALPHNTRTDLRRFMGGLAENLRVIAEAKHIHLAHHFESDAGDICWVDRDKLEKMVFNLGVNAIKFTPREGRVDIDVNVKDQAVQLVVRDTGPGIKPEEQALMFERFWQADMSVRRKHGGVGIGLALVKSLTRSLGGSIEVESRRGEGTTFIVTLPLILGEDTAAESDDSHSPDSLEALHQQARLSAVSDDDDSRPVEQTPELWDGTVSLDGKNLRVLIADDEPALRRYLAEAMTSFSVIEARNGREALELARQHRPHIIILDYMMPEMDGLEVTRALRSHPPTSRIPVLFITANAENLPRLQALEAGVNEFITKPFSTVELEARVRNLVRQKEFERDLIASKDALEAAHEALKENEVRLLQAERLSSLGRMSAGIIHEVNNPLNYTRSALHALKSFRRQLDPENREDYDEVLGDVSEGVERVIRIVSDLRAFTRGNPSAMVEVHLAPAVESARRLISHELAGLDLRIDVPEDLVVNGNANQLTQVFMNLLENASSFVLAAKKRGETPCIKFQARHLPEGSVLVTIRDNGSGIAPEDVPKVFDPFFTRRDVGTGTGLGLSICHQILQAHGATVEVHSQRDQYTEFSLCFPPPGSVINQASPDLESL